MNLIPDKVGANPKQLAILGGLVVVGIVSYFMMKSDPVPETAPVTKAAKGPAISRTQVAVENSGGAKLATRSGSRSDEFHPTLKLPEGTDITKIDPTLKTELLAKLKKVPLEGGSRSVFDFGQAPPPPPPKVTPIKPEVLAAEAKAREAAELAAKNTPPPIPKPPPIPLKFYGYANKTGAPNRKAFFLDGDDIQIMGENDVIRGRYKVVRIGINSATVEDLTTHDQQTLPLVAEMNT